MLDSNYSADANTCEEVYATGEQIYPLEKILSVDPHLQSYVEYLILDVSGVTTNI